MTTWVIHTLCTVGNAFGRVVNFLEWHVIASPVFEVVINRPVIPFLSIVRPKDLAHEMVLLDIIASASCLFFEHWQIVALPSVTGFLFLAD